MGLVVFEFFVKWIRDGRFPREELPVRWWIAALGVVVVGALAVALVIVSID